MNKIKEQAEFLLMCKAIQLWGSRAQLEMVIEESSELITAVQKFKRNPSSDTEDHIIEEAVDTEIMIDQLKILFPNPEKWEMIRKQKLVRLGRRIRLAEEESQEEGWKELNNETKITVPPERTTSE